MHLSFLDSQQPGGHAEEASMGTLQQAAQMLVLAPTFFDQQDGKLQYMLGNGELH